MQMAMTDFSPVQQARAKRLPAPSKGKMVKVPLELLPIWLELHSLEIVQYSNGTLMVRKDGKKKDGIQTRSDCSFQS